MNTNEDIVKTVPSRNTLPVLHNWKLSSVGCKQRAPTSFKQSWKDFELLRPIVRRKEKIGS